MIPLWRIPRRQFESESAPCAANPPSLQEQATASFAVDSGKRSAKERNERVEALLREAKPDPTPITQETSNRIFEQAFAEARVARNTIWNTTGIGQRSRVRIGLCLGTIAAIALLPVWRHTANPARPANSADALSTDVLAVTALEQTVSDTASDAPSDMTGGSLSGRLSNRQNCTPPSGLHQANIARLPRFNMLSKAGDLPLPSTTWEAPIHMACGFTTFGLYVPVQPASETKEPEEESLLICIVPEAKRESTELPPAPDKGTPFAPPETPAGGPECVVLTAISLPSADAKAQANLISMFHPEVQRSSLTLTTLTPITML